MMRFVKGLVATIFGTVALLLALVAVLFGGWCFIHGAQAAWHLYPDIAWGWIKTGLGGGLLGFLVALIVGTIASGIAE